VTFSDCSKKHTKDVIYDLEIAGSIVMDDFERALRGRLGKVLANPKTLREFRQWFMTAWWDAESAVSEEVYEAGVSIERHRAFPPMILRSVNMPLTRQETFAWRQMRVFGRLISL
jgi:hypothetical protein